MGVVVARALGEWLRDHGADSGPAEPWAYGVLGMVHVTTEWWLDRRTLSRKDLVEYMTSLLWSGLAGNGLAGPSPGSATAADTDQAPVPHAPATEQSQR